MRGMRVILWLMFFVVCFGLGYPTLNRFDPSKVGGMSDSGQYFRIVVDGPSAAAGPWRYRILVPFLARPVYRMALGHIGTWNPISFSMLVVNAAFCASLALVLVLIARALGFPLATGLITAFAYLLNFNVANLQLAGLVDSAEAFLIGCLMFLLLQRSWNALPALGVIGCLAKETFIPIALLFVCGWVWREKRKPWIQVSAMAVVGGVVVLLVRAAIEGRVVSPMAIAITERTAADLSEVLRNTIRALGSWSVWVPFLWLLPFAARGISRLPKEAVFATALSLMGAFGLAVLNNLGPNTSRPLFNVAGPCLCLAFAIGVTELSSKGKGHV